MNSEEDLSVFSFYNGMSGTFLNIKYSETKGLAQMPFAKNKDDAFITSRSCYGHVESISCQSLFKNNK